MAPNHTDGDEPYHGRSALPQQSKREKKKREGKGALSIDNILHRPF
jgi:hypothetical protein